MPRRLSHQRRKPSFRTIRTNSPGGRRMATRLKKDHHESVRRHDSRNARRQAGNSRAQRSLANRPAAAHRGANDLHRLPDGVHHRPHEPAGRRHGVVAVSAAIMLLEIPFTIPAFILAVRGKALGVAACLAGFATFAYVIFWIQVYAEVTAKAAS